MIAQHSSASNEHFTPKEYVEPARATLGGITLDPASCEEANRVVQASTWFGPTSQVLDAQDGLRIRWGQDPSEPDFMYAQRVFLNPPGGLLRRNADGVWCPVIKKPGAKSAGPGTSSMAVWWGKLCEEFYAGHVESFIFVGFALELLRLSQDPTTCRWPITRFNLCFPRNRIRFVTPNGPGDSPTHANVIVAGCRVDCDPGAFAQRFLWNFQNFGEVVGPYYSNAYRTPLHQ